MSEKGRWLTGAFTALALTLAAAALTASTAVRRTAFCGPAAQLAGLLSGAPCVKDGEDYRLIGSERDLSVIPACAAVDYFCLMAGFLSLLMTWRGLRPGWQAAVLPAAWGLTCVFNALRLVSCWHGDRVAEAWLPASVWPAAHMAVGDATFLSGLVLVFWVMAQRRRNDGQRSVS